MAKGIPLVTVIALCYNHEKFVEKTLQSIVSQSYTNIELIIVDDFSTDKSREKILQFSENNFCSVIIFNEKNLGNCRSFNKAFAIAKGKYIIDLSTDDVMLPERIEKQVKKFEQCNAQTGVVHTGASYIDEKSKLLKSTPQSTDKSLPEGDVYMYFLKGSFIIPCTMMIKKEVLDQLGGYDETLAYEDFDFWIRSSRTWEYAYIPEILSLQRIVAGSHSTNFYRKHNKLVQTMVSVCKKALILNKSEEENQALLIRMRSNLMKCILSENFQSGKELTNMIEDLKGHNFRSWLLSKMLLLRLPFGLISNHYLELRRFIKFKI